MANYCLTMEEIIALLEQVASDILSPEECHLLTSSCIVYAAKNHISNCDNLFSEDQLSSASVINPLNLLRQGEDEDSHKNWQWLLAKTPGIWNLCQNQAQAQASFPSLVVIGLRKSKAVTFGRLLSRYNVTSDPFCRVGQILGFWLGNLYLARGWRIFPEKLRSCYELFLEWDQHRLSTNVALPFQGEGHEFCITRKNFPFAMDDPHANIQAGRNYSVEDPDFQIALGMSLGELENYVLSGFHGTLAEFRKFMVEVDRSNQIRWPIPEPIKIKEEFDPVEVKVKVEPVEATDGEMEVSQSREWSDRHNGFRFVKMFTKMGKRLPVKKRLQFRVPILIDITDEEDRVVRNI